MGLPEQTCTLVSRGRNRRRPTSQLGPSLHYAQEGPVLLSGESGDWGKGQTLGAATTANAKSSAPPRNNSFQVRANDQAPSPPSAGPRWFHPTVPPASSAEAQGQAHDANRRLEIEEKRSTARSMAKPVHHLAATPTDLDGKSSDESTCTGGSSNAERVVMQDAVVSPGGFWSCCMPTKGR